MTFLEQFELLRAKTPHIGLQCVQNENSPYCQYTEKSKNCYMTFASYQSEDCIYNHRVFYCTDCVDCTLCHKSQLCYECLDCINDYNCNFCDHCENAIDCDYCHYCIGTENCFGCVGLNRKKFYIFNEQVSKEEYLHQLPELKKLSPQEISARMESLLTSVPRVAMYGKNNESSAGENIHNCKNTFWAFDSKGLHDCLYIYHGDDSKNLIDCSHLGWSEECYEIMSGGNLNNCMFCTGCWYSNNLSYCELVYNSHDCFGCVSLNHKEFHILNRPYNKEEYFKETARIIEQMKKPLTSELASARRERAGERDAGLVGPASSEAELIQKEYGKWFSSTYPKVLTYGF